MSHHFEEWAANFKRRFAFVAGVRGAPADRQPVHRVLEKLTLLQLLRGTPEQLHLNTLYACYQAAHAMEPDQHHSAVERDELRASHKALKVHLLHINATLGFITNHSSMANKAIRVGFNGGKAALTDGQAAEVLEDLQQALQRFRRGLEEIQEIDHPIHITSADFSYPPFEFDIPIQDWHNKTKNLAHVGLMFHLTYLFKYFTTPHLPERIDARFIDWRLKFSGPMLKGSGEAHAELVAPLVNAVFRERYSPLHVQNRLKEFTRNRSKGSKLQNVPIFIGWTLRDEIPTT